MQVLKGTAYITPSNVAALFKFNGNILKPLFLTHRFFGVLGVVMFLYLFSYGFPWLMPVAHVLLSLLLLLTAIDLRGLHALRNQLAVSRKLPGMLSLGDPQNAILKIKNNTSRKLNGYLIDETPVQLQKRDLKLPVSVNAGAVLTLTYEFRVLQRGLYVFHDALLFLVGRLKLANYRISFPLEEKVKAYPSVIQMKHFEHRVFNRTARQHGNYQLRKLGQSYEFEQIKEYVAGDDHRAINWKASSRSGTLMVNQFDEERSQNVYAIIDKSRVMNMPFNGLSLLDHAINTTLVISNIALKKGDKVGLITFSQGLGSLIKADNKPRQLHKIMEALYNEQPREGEADYDLIHTAHHRLMRNRSLVFFFTNLESKESLHRLLPMLRHLNRRHLLIVVFFKNMEVEEYSLGKPESTRDLYYRSIARTFIHEKEEIVENLRQYGIQSILTPPDELSLQIVQHYLELKSTYKI